MKDVLTTETARIADQLRRACEGDAWHGPSLRELTQGLGATEAAARPLPGAHTIWEIVHHIAAWEDAVRRRLGEESVSLDGEADWPPVREVSEAAWRATLARLESGNRRLREAIAGFPAERLDEVRPDSGQTYYLLMHGLIQHDIYHAGQIGLLKKLVAGASR